MLNTTLLGSIDVLLQACIARLEPTSNLVSVYVYVCVCVGLCVWVCVCVGLCVSV